MGSLTEKKNPFPLFLLHSGKELAVKRNAFEVSLRNPDSDSQHKSKQKTRDAAAAVTRTP